MGTEVKISAPEKWSKIIEEWQASGLSQAEFCRRYGLEKRYFSKWKNRLAPPESPEIKETPFVEIPLKVLESTHNTAVDIGLNIRTDGTIIITIKR